ncbi:DUF3870 domain-containing protein [Ammoniphilus sp. 3BR4]|uniref:DUF3870 domain-containing protein n=1 Tax=Ammoniphilus sp. 3BR4 TaxID=3158265 RepID=UPI003465A1C9
MKTQDTVLVTGFAQVPKGTTLYEMYKTMAVVLVIDCKTEVIEDAEFTCTTDLMNYYLSDLVKGYNLKEGINPLLDTVRQHCIIPSQGALVQALRSAWDRYQESKPNR